MTSHQATVIEAVIEIAETQANGGTDKQWWRSVAGMLRNCLSGKGGTDRGFAEFWAAYPRKIGKPNALKAWKRLNCAAIAGQVVEAVQNWCRSEQWRKDGGEFIPHPATWLNRNGWEDEIEIKVKTAPAVQDSVLADWRKFLQAQGHAGKWPDPRFAPQFLRDEFHKSRAA